MLRYAQQHSSTLEANPVWRSKVAFWKRNGLKYEEMARLIQDQPGIRPGQLAEAMKVQRSTVLRRLPALEEAGILLSEDQQGGLSVFGRRK